MSAFFLFIFVVYSGMHAYAFLKARSAIGFGHVAGTAIAGFMLLMVFALFLIRALEERDYDLTARLLAYVAYIWMAALFLYCCSSVLFDLAGLATRIAGWIGRTDVASFLPTNRLSFFISASVALAICLYGYFEARDIRVERVRVETSKLPAGIDRLTIAQISDVHLGLIIRHDRLKRMLEKVKEAQPDIFISSGDLVDAQINHLTGLADLLRSIETKYGNYAITGNHEYYAGLETAVEFTKLAGFTMIRNQAVDAGPIILVGVDDRTAVQLHIEAPPPEHALLARQPKNKFVLFLKHQPRIDRSTIGLFDLQLSGHTHKGQIFPFTFITEFVFPLNAGTYDLGQGSLLHVSRGTGTWGPPIRFLAPPEVTIYELVRKKVA